MTRTERPKESRRRKGPDPAYNDIRKYAIRFWNEEAAKLGLTTRHAVAVHLYENPPSDEDVYGFDKPGCVVLTPQGWHYYLSEV